jgi:WD40 repeat protein
LRGELTALAFDPNGRFLFCVGDTLWIAPLDGRPPVKLEGFTRVPGIYAAAVSPSGRLVAAGYWTGDNVDRTLRVWDLERGTTRAYDLPQPPPRRSKSASTPAGKNVRSDGFVTVAFADELTLYTGDYGGVRRWDLATGKNELVIGVEETLVDAIIRPKQGLAVTCENAAEVPRGCAAVKTHDLVRHTSRKLTASEIEEFGSHMRGLRAVDLAATGQILATGGPDGIIRIRRLSGGEPHLLVGHKGGAFPAISPDLKWIASTGQDNTLRLWPMPDLDKPPLHTLPHAGLVAKLKSLTNLRAVRDAKTAGGWRIETGPFPGWKNMPTWQP